MIAAPEPKTAKNRMYIDISGGDGRRPERHEVDAEVQRLVVLLRVIRKHDAARVHVHGRSTTT